MGSDAMQDETVDLPTRECPTCSQVMGSDALFHEGRFICGRCRRIVEAKKDQSDALLALAKVLATFDLHEHWYSHSTAQRVGYVEQAEQILEWHLQRRRSA